MDDIPFAARGLQAVTLFGLSSKSLRIHTPRDRADLLEERGLREVGELIAALIDEVDGGRCFGQYLAREARSVGGKALEERRIR
jgi:hypothetical protein